MSFDAAAKRVLRRLILQLLQENHEAQRRRMNDAHLLAVLRNLQYDIVLNELLTMLQELSGRGYIKYDILRNERDREIRLQKLEITPLGVDVYEGTRTDPSIDPPPGWTKG